MGVDTIDQTAGPSEPSSPAPQPGVAPRSGRVAWIVISLAVAFGIFMGFLVYFRATDGSMQVTKWRKSYAERGRSMTATECVVDVIHWYENDCKAPARMCLDAVPYGVADCLAARGKDGRLEECKAVGNDLKPAQWAYERCKSVGVDKKSPKGVKESCTAAWRSLDTFCKSGGAEVVL